MRHAQTYRRITAAAVLLAAVVAGQSAASSAPSPIKHVVIVYMENHSFDNVLGFICAVTLVGRCDGATTGQTDDGTLIPLPQAADLIPGVGHGVSAQQVAMNGGAMNGFSLIGGCTRSDHACYQQYTDNQIPNLASLAETFVVSDRTFQMDPIPTWGAHLELAAGTLDGFEGGNPQPVPGITPGRGWGCDGNVDGQWRAFPADPAIFVPSCVPTASGSGAYRTTPVAPVPTIMDRLDAAGVSWKIYAPSAADGDGDNGGYGRQICPAFAECLDGPQHLNVVPPEQFATDAQAGTLPRFSIVIPRKSVSQHNKFSMLAGDDFIGNVSGALMDGPDWGSSAMFVTYDDCGCFYDHVVPPPGLGIRSPMVIVSPFAIARHTDSNTATYASMLAYTEHTFGLAPLSDADANAYDFAGSFDYTQQPLPPIRMASHRIPAWEVRWIMGHPPRENDPT